MMKPDDERIQQEAFAAAEAALEAAKEAKAKGAGDAEISAAAETARADVLDDGLDAIPAHEARAVELERSPVVREALGRLRALGLATEGVAKKILLGIEDALAAAGGAIAPKLEDWIIALIAKIITGIAEAQLAKLQGGLGA